MVFIYAMKITALPDPCEVSEVLHGLSEERCQKILSQKKPENRRQSLGAGLLQKMVLERHGIRLEEVRYGAKGKPEVEGICFNLSHSDELVICAVSEHSVGCDAERIKKARMKVAEHFFCEGEKVYLQQFAGDSAALDLEFTRLWTMKESYIKMTGDGMSLPLKAFEVRMSEASAVIFRDGKQTDCFVKEYEVPGYRITVCAEEEEFAEELEWVEFT